MTADRVVPQVNNEAWVAGYRWALTHLDDPGVRADAGRYDAEEANREVPGTSVQVDELHDRIALLEHRNGQLDANAHAAQDRLKRLHREHDRALDDLRREVNAKVGLENRLELELRASREYAEQSAAMSRRVAELRDRLAKVQAESDERYAQLVKATEVADRRWEALEDSRREATTAHRQVDTAAEASDALQEVRLGRPGAWEEVHSTLEGTELLEAQGGVFVPIPAGYNVSVTVTPPYVEEAGT